VLQTKEWTPLEHGVDNKYYAPGVGEVAEYTVKGGGDFLELVSVTRVKRRGQAQPVAATRR
jgi:hypothetical protein